MDRGFAPGEGAGGLVIALDEGIDVFPEVGDASEAGGLQRLSAEDGESAFDLIEPGGVRRGEVEMNVLVRPCHGNGHRPKVRRGQARFHAAATASCQCAAASARKVRSVARETRWR